MQLIRLNFGVFVIILLDLPRCLKEINYKQHRLKQLQGRNLEAYL